MVFWPLTKTELFENFLEENYYVQKIDLFNFVCSGA
jgi:hypothetical protein